MINIFEVIEQYDKIAVCCHIRPDYDAYGSSCGVATVIKDLYPHKQVMLMSETQDYLLEKMGELSYDQFENLSDALLITTDTATLERISGATKSDFAYCIKIDHHIPVDDYGDINIVDEHASSASEVITLLCKNLLNKTISKKAATYLYYGIVGDSDRFKYDATSQTTFEAASYLLDCGIDISSIYRSMYSRKAADLKVQADVLSRYVDDAPIAYYVYTKEDFEKSNLTASKVKEFINILSGYDEYEVWFCVLYAEEHYRVSLRSKRVPIDHIANKYEGGGHMLASGCKIHSLDQLPVLISELKEAISNYYD